MYMNIDKQSTHNHTHAQPPPPTQAGYVLTLTLLLISMSVVLVSLLVNRTVSYQRLSVLDHDREQAKMLALSGVEIALSQMTAPVEDAQAGAKKEEKTQEKSGEKEQQKWLSRLLALTNHWQEFKFKEEIDGIEGECTIYISSEQGKFNLNSLYNFKEKKFIKQDSFDAQKLLQLIFDKISTSLNAGNPIESLENIFKQHDRPLDDVTELLALKEFQKFASHVFPTFPAHGEQKSESFILTDLFTVMPVASGRPQLEPLLLSRSVKNMLGLKPDNADEEKRIQEAQELAKSLKPTMNWQEDWNKLLSKRVGKEFEKLPVEIRSLFSSKFEVTAFSVVSYGKVGAVTQKLCAIVTQVPSERDQAQRYSIKKLYWLS